MISSTALNANPSTSGFIDVQKIVNSLIEARKGPLSRVESSISKNQTTLSALAVFKSKASELLSAVNEINSPSTYNIKKSASSNTDVVAVSANTNAIDGVYPVSVSQVASASVIEISGFSDEEDELSLPASFKLRVAGVDYEADLPGSPMTVIELKDWINGLGAEVSASFLETTSNNYSLMISGTLTGSENEVSLRPSANAFESANSGDGYQVEIRQDAQDAEFTVNSVGFSRASNSVNDVIRGVTLDLVGAIGSSNVSISTLAAQSTREAISNFVASYNDLNQFFRSASRLTSFTSEESAYANYAASLLYDSSAKAMMSQIKSSYQSGVRVSSTGQSVPFAAFGISINSEGDFVFNESDYADAVDDGLLSSLKGGVEVGYRSATSSGIADILSDGLAVNGLIGNAIFNYRDRLYNLDGEKLRAERSLESLRTSLIRKYADLDSQMAKFQNLSSGYSNLFQSLKSDSNN